MYVVVILSGYSFIVLYLELVEWRLDVMFLRRILLLIFSQTAYSARILGLFPFPGLSHQKSFDPLMIALAKKGHNVTVATFFPLNEKPDNYEEVSLESLGVLRLEMLNIGKYENPSGIYRVPFVGNIIDQVNQLTYYGNVGFEICKKIVKYSPFIEKMKFQYDLVITEHFISECMMGLLQAFNITVPVIGMSSCSALPWTYSEMGAENNPSFVPMVTTSFSSQMIFAQRVENTIIKLMSMWHRRNFIEKEKNFIEDFYQKKINHFYYNLIFLNAFNVLHGVKPQVPGLIEIGGIHLEPSKKQLPDHIAKFVNESTDGVIIFSLGSQTKSTSLSEKKQNMLINVFSKLKQRVIWKYASSAENGTFLGNNILKIKWMPQLDLLQHENVKAIICHGGNLGMIEAIYAGKPMVLIPILADQRSNSAAAKQAGVAEVLSLKDFDDQDLTNAIHYVLSKDVQEKASEVSQSWRERESSPLDTAVFWTEKVIRWGHKLQLHSQSRDLPLYQYLLIDIMAFLSVSLILTIASILFILKLILIPVRSYMYSKVKLQ
ncbi:UDP-glycosyltransferase UGT5-like [Leptidea sinapis]|uniref:UDP-glycosyltransferase UGT5-like n=1 Tax=Leptidea sinapis TaxID=189913 RepID=UPI0021C2E111|nr:UDP-glycosyltransferase UGT5-like [Leptidea sinapis]